MRVDPARTADEILEELMAVAERQYGGDRARELHENVRHLARMMAQVGERSLDLDDDAPDTSGIPDRSLR